MDAPTSAQADEYPWPAFYFRVKFGTGSGAMEEDTSFQEVSGIGSKIETKALVEGGQNRFVHQLPEKVSHSNLVLKRGIGKLDSPLVVWCQSVFEGDFALPISPMPVLVLLLNESGQPARVWSFANAYPVNWEIEAFNSMKNEVAIESIELSYTYSNRLY